jgi:hypothetical protein
MLRRGVSGKIELLKGNLPPNFGTLLDNKEYKWTGETSGNRKALLGAEEKNLLFYVAIFDDR